MGECFPDGSARTNFSAFNKAALSLSLSLSAEAIDPQAAIDDSKVYQGAPHNKSAHCTCALGWGVRL